MQVATPYNVEWLRFLVERGPKHYPGATEVGVRGPKDDSPFDLWRFPFDLWSAFYDYYYNYYTSNTAPSYDLYIRYKYFIACISMYFLSTRQDVHPTSYPNKCWFSRFSQQLITEIDQTNLDLLNMFRLFLLHCRSRCLHVCSASKYLFQPSWGLKKNTFMDCTCCSLYDSRSQHWMPILD